MTSMNRRGFIKTLGVSGLAGLGWRNMAFADASDTQNIVVVIFLRGACDFLNLFPPVSGDDRQLYETARPNLHIPLSQTLPLDGQFGLHPAAAALKTLFDNNQLAIVRAVGNTVQPSRSHFDAQALLESGTPGTKGTSTGWLARYFSTIPNLPPSITIPSVAASSYTPTSFLGDPAVLTMDDPDYFSLDNAHWAWDGRLEAVLPGLHAGDSPVEKAGSQALTAMQIIAGEDFSGYVPSGGAVYPNGYFGDQLKMLAQIIKMNVGLRMGALDFGGWDTHSDQGNGATGYFSDDLVTPLANGLLAFLTDLGAEGNYLQRTTVIVQTEFGRRVRENADYGTDHGYGADILISGAASQIIGGFHGNWPGLASTQLFEGMDIAVTTDFRQVLSEILIRRLENPYLGTIFPGYTGYSPLGVVQGTDLDPIYDNPSDEIFSDGFED